MASGDLPINYCLPDGGPAASSSNDLLSRRDHGNYELVFRQQLGCNAFHGVETGLFERKLAKAKLVPTLTA
jgi:hypothetical protein